MFSTRLRGDLREVSARTCTFLWGDAEPERLTSRVREVCTDGRSQLLLSAASAWEVAVKYRLGKLPLPEAPSRLVPEKRRMHRITELPLTESAALAVEQLPNVHRDPFDRVLVAQALVEDCTLLTPDRVFDEYPVRVES